MSAVPAGPAVATPAVAGPAVTGPTVVDLDGTTVVSHGARRVRDWSARDHGPVGVDGPVGSWARACAALLDAAAHPSQLPTPPDRVPAARATRLETLTRIYAEAELVETGQAPTWWPGGAAAAVAAAAEEGSTPVG